MAGISAWRALIFVLILSSCVAASVGVRTKNGLACSSFRYGMYLVTAGHCPLDLSLVASGHEKVSGDYAVYRYGIDHPRPACREARVGEHVRVVTMFGVFETDVMANGRFIVLGKDLGAGSSGSAIYAEDGAIVGMVTARFPGSWSLGVPAKVLCDVLESLD